MSLETQLQETYERIGAEFKTMRILLSGSGTGNVSGLQTTATNIVTAINEVLASANGGDMLKSTYDPTSKNTDAFARSNMTGTQTVSTLSDFTSGVNTLLQGLIDDVGAASSTKTWSSSKINSQITQAISNALEGEDLSDIADEIANLVITDNGLVNTNKVQTFTAAQKLQARSNIDVFGKAEIGDINTDFVAIFENSLL